VDVERITQMEVKEIGIALPTNAIMVFLKNRADGDDIVSKIVIDDVSGKLDIHYESGVRKTFPSPQIVWYGVTSFRLVEGKSS
jgi:hypothetical protein